MYDSESVRRGIRGKASLLNHIHRTGYTVAGHLAWSEWEVETLKQHFPDYETLCRLLNRRTRGAIRGKAQGLGLTEKRRFWSEREKTVMPPPYRKGLPLAEIQTLLDDRTVRQIYSKASRMKVRRPARYPKSTGLTLIDLILMRAADKGYTRAELNEWSGRKRYWIAPRKYDWVAISQVLQAMGGEVVPVFA